MAVLPRCIKILINLFKSIPDDVYDEDQIQTGISSSLYQINFAISKTARLPRINERNFIFGNNIEYYINENNKQSEQAQTERLWNLFNNTRELQFIDKIDNEISKKVCSYFITYFSLKEGIKKYTDYSDITHQFTEKSFGHIIPEFKDRKDYPVILCYLFCQILFAHSYRKVYNEELSIKYPSRLLFNNELDKYQFSLPYEDQVTCSYFVYRYIYLPEERERQYTERNKYDCGFHSSEPKKYSFAEVNKTLANITNQENVSKKTTSFSRFAQKMNNLNIIKECKNKSKNYGLLKLYMLFKKIKNRRDVVRSKKSGDNYGFDILKMLKNIELENYTFDKLPYHTANGYHCTILVSEIKKDIELCDLVTLTSYYVMSNSYLYQIDKLYKSFFNCFYENAAKGNDEFLKKLKSSIRISNLVFDSYLLRKLY